MVDAAFRHAFSGRPGPVYLDIPGDVILARIDESEVNWEVRRSFVSVSGFLVIRLWSTAHLT